MIHDNFFPTFALYVFQLIKISNMSSTLPILYSTSSAISCKEMEVLVDYLNLFKLLTFANLAAPKAGTRHELFV